MKVVKRTLFEEPGEKKKLLNLLKECKEKRKVPALEIEKEFNVPYLDARFIADYWINKI